MIKIIRESRISQTLFLLVLALNTSSAFAESPVDNNSVDNKPSTTKLQPVSRNDSDKVSTERMKQDIYRVPVTVVRASPGTIEQHTGVQGVIEALNEPQLKTKVSAEVKKIYVDEGDVVKQGQVLALLDDEGFRLNKEAAETQIKSLKPLLQNQLLTLKRDQTLVSKKMIPESKLDASLALVKQTRAQLEHAKVLLKKANYQLTHTRIIAPISGIVQQRSVSPGDYVNPMSPSSPPLFQVVDTRHLRARLYFPETLAESIKTGMKVTLKRDDQTLPAVIKRTRPMLEAQNRALHALADFDNVKDWKPGETITADVVLKRHKNTIIIPELALIQRPAGLVVYVLKDGMAKEVVVETGIRQGDKIEILSGLKEGDLIALDGAAYLSNQIPVEIQHKAGQENTQSGENSQ